MDKVTWSFLDKYCDEMKSDKDMHRQDSLHLNQILVLYMASLLSAFFSTENPAVDLMSAHAQ